MPHMQAANTAVTAEPPIPATDWVVNEFLTFWLGNEEYGIEIFKVQEIRSCDAIAQMVNSPGSIKGAINLRGIVVPVISMRIKFQLSEAAYNQFTAVIILNVAGCAMGIVVDRVSDVVALGEEQMRPAPESGVVVNTEYIIGLGAVDERMLILVDIEKMMSSSDIGLIEKSMN